MHIVSNWTDCFPQETNEQIDDAIDATENIQQTPVVSFMMTN